jgi:hypothetical protein
MRLFWRGLRLAPCCLLHREFRKQKAAARRKQGALKKKQKESAVPAATSLFLRFFEIFRSDFRKCFMVFLSSSCRETAKNAIKTKPKGKDDRKKIKVFELPLLRNAQKRHKQISTTKNYLPTPFSGHLPDDIRRFQKGLKSPLTQVRGKWQVGTPVPGWV